MAATHLPMIPCERHLPAWPLGSSVIFLSQPLPRKEKEGALRLALGRRSVQKAQWDWLGRTPMVRGEAKPSEAVGEALPLPIERLGKGHS